MLRAAGSFEDGGSKQQKWLVLIVGVWCPETKFLKQRVGPGFSDSSQTGLLIIFRQINTCLRLGREQDDKKAKLSTGMRRDLNLIRCLQC